MKNKKTVKYIDLFAGLGGIRLGFTQAFTEAGYETECVLTSEIKPAAIKALTTNFGPKSIRGDITTVAFAAEYNGEKENPQIHLFDPRTEEDYITFTYWGNNVLHLTWDTDDDREKHLQLIGEFTSK